MPSVPSKAVAVFSTSAASCSILSGVSFTIAIFQALLSAVLHVQDHQLFRPHDLGAVQNIPFHRIGKTLLRAVRLGVGQRVGKCHGTLGAHHDVGTARRAVHVVRHLDQDVVVPPHLAVLQQVAVVGIQLGVCRAQVGQKPRRHRRHNLCIRRHIVFLQHLQRKVQRAQHVVGVHRLVVAVQLLGVPRTGKGSNVLVHLTGQLLGSLGVQRVHQAAHCLPLVDVVHKEIEVRHGVDLHLHARIFHVLGIGQDDTAALLLADGRLAHTQDLHGVAHLLDVALVLAVAILGKHQLALQLTFDCLCPDLGHKVCITQNTHVPFCWRSALPAHHALADRIIVLVDLRIAHGVHLLLGKVGGLLAAIAAQAAGARRLGARAVLACADRFVGGHGIYLPAGHHGHKLIAKVTNILGLFVGVQLLDRGKVLGKHSFVLLLPGNFRLRHSLAVLRVGLFDRLPHAVHQLLRGCRFHTGLLRLGCQYRALAEPLPRLNAFKRSAGFRVVQPRRHLAEHSLLPGGFRHAAALCILGILLRFPVGVFLAGFLVRGGVCGLRTGGGGGFFLRHRAYSGFLFLHFGYFVCFGKHGILHFFPVAGYRFFRVRRVIGLLFRVFARPAGYMVMRFPALRQFHPLHGLHLVVFRALLGPAAVFQLAVHLRRRIGAVVSLGHDLPVRDPHLTFAYFALHSVYLPQPPAAQPVQSVPAAFSLPKSCGTWRQAPGCWRPAPPRIPQR
nr:MAG TPA: hypothetical protein [Caudoviricetes sp.]